MNAQITAPTNEPIYARKYHQCSENVKKAAEITTNTFPRKVLNLCNPLSLELFVHNTSVAQSSYDPLASETFSELQRRSATKMSDESQKSIVLSTIFLII